MGICSISDSILWHILKYKHTCTNFTDFQNCINWHFMRIFLKYNVWLHSESQTSIETFWEASGCSKNCRTFIISTIRIISEASLNKKALTYFALFWKVNLKGDRAAYRKAKGGYSIIFLKKKG